MLHIVKDDFDESPEDILNTINKMINSKTKEIKDEEKNIKKED